MLQINDKVACMLTDMSDHGWDSVTKCLNAHCQTPYCLQSNCFELIISDKGVLIDIEHYTKAALFLKQSNKMVEGKLYIYPRHPDETEYVKVVDINELIFNGYYDILGRYIRITTKATIEAVLFLKA